MVVNLIIFYLKLIYLSLKWFFSLLLHDGTSHDTTCLVGLTALVTGGNSGIGYAVSTLLASRGCKVIIADLQNAEESKNQIITSTGNAQVTWKHLNLGSLTSIRAFAREVTKEETKIDILINNAGIGISKTKITGDNLNEVMQVNFFGAFLLTHLLIPCLKASSEPRVMFASSIQAYFSSLTTDNLNQELNPVDFEVGVCTSWHLYCNSKLCNILAAQEFSTKLQKYNITVNAADPGAVTTRLFLEGDNFDVWYMRLVRIFGIYKIILFFIGQDNFGGAQTLFYLASRKHLKDQTGQNFFRCRPFPKPEILQNREFCEDVWKKIETIVQLNPNEKL